MDHYETTDTAKAFIADMLWTCRLDTDTVTHLDEAPMEYEANLIDTFHSIARSIRTKSNPRALTVVLWFITYHIYDGPIPHYALVELQRCTSILKTTYKYDESRAELWAADCVNGIYKFYDIMYRADVLLISELFPEYEGYEHQLRVLAVLFGSDFLYPDVLSELPNDEEWARLQKRLKRYLIKSGVRF